MLYCSFRSATGRSHCSAPCDEIRRPSNSRFCPDNSFVSFRRVRDDDVDTNRMCLRCNRNERLGLGRNKVRARGIFRVDR